jgi:hypothetical protein
VAAVVPATSAAAVAAVAPTPPVAAAIEDNLRQLGRGHDRSWDPHEAARRGIAGCRGAGPEKEYRSTSLEKQNRQTLAVPYFQVTDFK